MPYDLCVINMGSVTNTAGIAGAGTHAVPVKPIANLLRIRRRLEAWSKGGEPGRFTTPPWPVTIANLGDGRALTLPHLPFHHAGRIDRRLKQWPDRRFMDRYRSVSRRTPRGRTSACGR
ncbi:MAG: hypothetical protein ACOC95_00380 [Planctomycetota bacterium]